MSTHLLSVRQASFRAALIVACAALGSSISPLPAEAIPVVPPDPLQTQTREAEQIEAGSRLAKHSKPRPIDHKPQLLEFGKHTLEVTPPEGYMLDVLTREDKKSFALIGPKRDDGSSAVLMINMIVSAEEESKLHPVDVIRNGMLDPFRNHLSNYKEDVKEPSEINGFKFDNTFYSGTAGAKAIKGFVYIGKIADGFCVLSGMDTQDGFTESQGLLVKSVESCRLVK
ncbi:MAG: hypothetical protein SGJ27_21755 [Candidatus Melainabacteria bacterium]|nr:hypothetical protein [Candidatus Melainabacteria bacterium]